LTGEENPLFHSFRVMDYDPTDNPFRKSTHGKRSEERRNE
jgi:hypothetical protein